MSRYEEIRNNRTKHKIVPGRALGLTIGSLLAAEWGLRFASLSLGILAGGTGFLYLIAYHLALKNIERDRLLKKSQKQGLFE